MSIERVIVKNYKGLKQTDVSFQPDLNILVGDNETGKSTLLEAINLGLTGQINRRDAGYQLHPFLFNKTVVDAWIAALKAGEKPKPPEILIEIYLKDDPSFALTKGTNNSQHLDTKGVKLKICLDEDHFADEYAAYVDEPDRISTVPIEFFHIEWLDFAHNKLTPRDKPLKPALIDPSALSNAYSASRYVLELARDYLSRKQQVDLSLSYRQLREVFQSDASVAKVNKELATKKGEVSDRTLSVALDMTARAGWETNVTPHLDDVPLGLVGKGEQTAVKIKLALEASEACDLLLIEEPETHQAHGNLSALIDHVAKKSGDKQLIMTTHSSFVLNKLGIDAAIMFNGKTGLRLEALPPTTRNYFMKLPGHDTLRMVLAKRTILVEGPSDELIVQKAYQQKHKKPALADGVEIISVRALAFKRFLDIAKALKIDVSIVTDNDGDVDAVKTKYADYDKEANIELCYSEDETLTTLEPHLVAINDLEVLKSALGMPIPVKPALLAYLTKNKTEGALRLFESGQELVIPEYIRRAVR